MSGKVRLGNIFEKDFVSFDTQGKNKKIIFSGKKNFKLGERVFSFVHISDEELEFYDVNKEELVTYLKTASKNEAYTETQDFIDRYIPLHPYLKFFNPTTTYDSLLETKYKILDALRFCLDKDYDERLIELSAIERYYIYRYSNRGEIPFLATPKIALLPNIIDINKYTLFLKPLKKVKASSLWDGQDMREPQDLTNELINFTKKQKPQLFEAYEISDPVSLLYLELFKMVEANNFIRVCKRCNIYFTLKGNYPANYCDRIRPGHKKNCQNEAAKEKETRKYKEESAEKLYNRIRTRIAKRMKEGAFGDDYLEKWESKAKPLYKEYLADKTADYTKFKAKLEELSK